MSKRLPEQPGVPAIKRYRFRAEVWQDVAELMEKLGPRFVGCAIKRVHLHLPGTSTPFKPGDVEVVLDVEELSLTALRDVIRTVPDGHVILQTVALPEEYTGERDYSID